MYAGDTVADIIVNIEVGAGLHIQISRQDLMRQSEIFRFMLMEPFFDKEFPSIEITDDDPYQLAYFFQILKNNCECRITDRNAAFMDVFAQRFAVPWIKYELELHRRGQKVLIGSKASSRKAHRMKISGKSTHRNTVYQLSVTNIAALTRETSM